MKSDDVQYQRQTGTAMGATMRARVGAWVCGLALAGASAVCAAPDARAESPTDAMRETIDRVLDVLGNASLRAPERAGDRIEALEAVINERFDHEEMGKRTLGKAQWEAMDAAQRKEFVNLFRGYLTHTYAGNVSNYSGEQVAYLKERQKGNFAEVQTKVFSNNVDVSVHYRLLQRAETWKVYDVVIDGISLVKNFRSQFERVIKRQSLNGLFDTLRNKLASSPRRDISRVLP